MKVKLKTTVLNTQEHRGHIGTPPGGTLSALSGTTDSNGQVFVTYTAPIFSYLTAVEAEVAGAKKNTGAIYVQVPGLLELSPDPLYKLIGHTSTHPASSIVAEHSRNHWHVRFRP